MQRRDCTNREFITRPMSLWLDLVRALAALAVLAGHAVQLGLYSGPWPFTFALQKNAVIVFFVLSGLVIAHSVDSRRPTLASYAIARAVRIVPVALPAVLFSLAVAWLGAWTDPASAMVKSHDLPIAVETLMAMTFLSESWQTGFAPNPPYWSLCYEVWFYALFAAATSLKGGKRIAWLVALAAIAGPNVLLLLPAWLVGVALARSPQARGASGLRAGLYVGVALATLWSIGWLTYPLHLALRAVAPWTLGYSFTALSDLVLALAVALGFMGLRGLTGSGEASALEPLRRPIRYMADISFAIYLFHWPLVQLLRMAGVSAGDSLPAFAALLALLVAACAGLSWLTERKRGQWRARLEAAFAPRPRALPAA